MINDNLVRQTIRDIDKLTKMLRESYVYEDENEVYNDEVYQEEPVYDEVNVDDKLSQIRSLALSGIQEYAENVDDPNYEVFKKIWMLCDKATSNKEQKNEQ